MITKFQPYTAYKDSGLQWLGDVPAHWKVRRIKTLFREKDERNGNGRGVLLSLTRSRGIIPQEEASNRIASAADFSKYKLCQPGDLVMNRMQAWSGMFAVSPMEGLVSPDYSVFKPFSASNVRYFEHLFKTPVLVDQFVRRSKGIGSGFNRLYTPDFGSVPVVDPPLSEQSAIVHFLDHIDRRIRRYIRTKQKLIKLLEEQKQAIINLAVARGSDPNVRLKPSGVEWLGDVPEHWDVLPLKRVCFFQEGPGLRNWQFTDSGIRVICVSNITEHGIDFTNYQRWISRDEYKEKYRHFTVNRCDLLLASSGNSWGKIAEFSGEEAVILNTSTIRLNSARYGKLSNEFLRLILQAEYIRLQLGLLLTGACQPNFGPSHLNRLVVAFPNDHLEQKQIVADLAAELVPLREAIDRNKHEISLLREYRTRLTADAVTGKIDVRQAAANMSDEVEESDQFTESESTAGDGEEGEEPDLDATTEETEA